MQTYLLKRLLFSILFMTGTSAILLCRGYTNAFNLGFLEAATGSQVPSNGVINPIKAESWLAQATTVTPEKSLVPGATGTKVKELQQRLKEKGFDPGPIDSTFGPGTKAAVIAFQKSKGLQADGIAGPQTLTALGIKLPVASQSASTASTPRTSSQTPKTSSSSKSATTTQSARANVAIQESVVVADRFYWSGPKGNLGLSLAGKFNSPEKMMETFDLSKVLSVFNGKQWTLSDILVSVDFNANGTTASWKVSGPRPVLEQYLDTLKAGYQNKTLLYDFGFSEVNFKPTASVESQEQGSR